MHPDAIEEMADWEERHWWYVSTHALVEACIRQFAPASQTLLDVGCGTGGLLLRLRSQFDVWGIDASRMAVARAKAKLSDLAGGRIQRAGIDENMPVSIQSAEGFDVVTCLDVLYHQDVLDWRSALRCVAQPLKHGGLLILQVAAFEALRGDHDRAVDGARRFRKKQIAQVLLESGFTIELISYRFAFLFPVLFALRLKRSLFPNFQPQSNLRMSVPNLAQAIGRSWALWENERILRGLAMPFGSSLFAVARRSGEGMGPVRATSAGAMTRISARLHEALPTGHHRPLFKSRREPEISL
jgi:SAM-dependent methyltransferase